MITRARIHLGLSSHVGLYFIQINIIRGILSNTNCIVCNYMALHNIRHKTLQHASTGIFDYI